jgi:biopolymer transport protein ExbB
MILQKIRDVAQMGIEPTESYQKFLALVAHGVNTEAEQAARSLKSSTRELVQAGLHSASETKVILEERLQVVLLAQRLHFERRLPLLAVIATAAPLMGLLGTVVGMVKTFALITVFGTGNAGKLSSGISEVLVATELGLAVAIPTLIAHGFLAHRIQKNLLLLERQALEFTTAVEVARTARQPAALSVAS